MPDPNLPLLLIENDTLNELKTDMSSRGMAGPKMVSGEVYFGWDGVKERLRHTLGILSDQIPGNKGHGDIDRDIDVLMTVDSGKTVGWDGATEPGAVVFFEQAVGYRGSSHAAVKLDRPRNPRVVLNWYV